MAKYVNVESGDYTLKIGNGGNIVLDTGVPSQPGKVIVTGDLEIRGATTSVFTNDLVIDDNIIQLNRPELIDDDADPGTPPVLPSLVPEDIISGIEVNRGAGQPTARWVYDGSISYVDPQTSSYDPVDINVIKGAWVPRVEGGTNSLLGIQAVSITTPGTDLNLLGVQADGTKNPGVLTVSGTEDYAERLRLRAAAFGSEAGALGLPSTITDDDIPNRKFINDRIQFQLTQTRQPRIQDGTFGATETFVEVTDSPGNVAGVSTATVGIDGVITSTFRDTTTRFFDVVIEGNAIRSTIEDQSLVLVGDRYGSVEIDDSLVLTPTSQHLNGLAGPGDAVIDPATPPVGTKLYSKIEGTGGTGIYFVNQEVEEDINGTLTVTKPSNRDEIISKNKAILYSMIF